jgi:hypothetical protein
VTPPATKLSMADRTTSILARLDTVLFFSDTLISLSVGITG